MQPSEGRDDSPPGTGLERGQGGSKAGEGTGPLPMYITELKLALNIKYEGSALSKKVMGSELHFGAPSLADRENGLEDG